MRRSIARRATTTTGGAERPSAPLENENLAPRKASVRPPDNPPPQLHGGSPCLSIPSSSACLSTSCLDTARIGAASRPPDAAPPPLRVPFLPSLLGLVGPRDGGGDDDDDDDDDGAAIPVR